MIFQLNHGVADNGNVASIANNINTARSQTYTYDELNRVSTAKTQATTGIYAWGLSFGYDPWANLINTTVTQGTGYSLSAYADGSNRLRDTPGSYQYDAAGNMIRDPVNSSYTYNAEGELASAAGVTYTYDGDGNRVKKSSGKLYWYGLGTDPLSESDASGNLTNEYIFLNGARIAMLQLSSSTVNYYVADHLGSSRVVTNASGTVLDDSDFYPFGGERSYASGSGNNYKFTGKERDTESGLDDFAARFYTSNYGRFLSADDAKYMHPADPQTFNLYSYVANNPLNAVDPTGHDPNRAMRYMRTVDDGVLVGVIETTQAEEENNDVVGDTIADVQQHELAVEAAAQAAGQQQQQQQQLQNQSASSSSDKRTDIMLSDNNVPPKPALKEGAQFEMDYKIVPQADTMQQLQDNSISLRDDSATQAKYSKMKVSLWESQRGEKWQWEGEPITGHGHDILNVFAQNADQRWYVDGKRVQMVIGKDSAGNLIKAWTVHVEVKPTGPVLTKVD